MGLACTRPDANSAANFPQKILLLGHTSAGKTTLLYGWKLGCDSIVKPLPTDGFNVEQIKHRGQVYIVWDLSGADSYRHRWRQFYHGTNVLIIVIDITTEEGLQFVMTDVGNILQERDLNDIPCIIVFNKSDLCGDKIESYQETAEIANLPNVFIMSCCAKDEKSSVAVLDMIDKVYKMSPSN